MQAGHRQVESGAQMVIDSGADESSPPQFWQPRVGSHFLFCTQEEEPFYYPPPAIGDTEGVVRPGQCPGLIVGREFKWTRTSIGPDSCTPHSDPPPCFPDEADDVSQWHILLLLREVHFILYSYYKAIFWSAKFLNCSSGSSYPSSSLAHSFEAGVWGTETHECTLRERERERGREMLFWKCVISSVEEDGSSMSRVLEGL